jgi:hypothetical protein
MVDDIPKFTQVIHEIKQGGYDVDKILSEYSDQEIKQLTRDLLIGQVKGLEDTKTRLLSECSFVESQIDLHRQRLYVYNELELMEFGLRRLKILRNTIKEIAAEDNVIDYRTAVDKFIESLEQRYDIKLRQKVKEEEQQQKYNDTTKPDNPNRTFSLYRNNKSSSVVPKPSALVDRQREIPSSSISYTYRKSTTTLSKTKKEDNQINPYHDEWDRSEDDHNT